MQKYMFVDVTEGREQLLSLPPLFLKGNWDSQKVQIFLLFIVWFTL